MKKKSLSLIAAAAAISLTLAACGGSSGNSTGNGGDGDKSFIYVTNNPIGINKFLESGKIGTEQAAEKFGGTAKIYESSDQVTQRQNLQAAVDEKPDVVIMITFDFEEMSKEFAEANPDQKFLLIDACPAEPPANLHCAVFREYEASYLLGIQAGMRTESNKIGSVVSVDIPFLHRYSDAFAQGAASVNSAASDTQLFIGGSNPFSDPAKAKEQALAIAAQGVDHVFAVGAGSNGGVMEAAAERGMTAYGVDVNQCPMAPGFVGDGTIKAVDVVVVTQVEKILNGNAEPVAAFGLAEGGMNLVSLTDEGPNSQCTVMEHPDVLDAVKQAKQDIIDGKIVLEDPAAG